MNRKALREKLSTEPTLERWLRTEDVARYDAFRRDPQGYSIDQVFEILRQHHRLYQEKKHD